MVGIYKITSPKGKVYIGQSWDIEKRWNQHCYGNAQQISRSIQRHGRDAHCFEVVHELPSDVSQSVLTAYEQLYIDSYRDTGAVMMNNRDAGSAGKMSDETKVKMSNARKGKPLCEQAKQKLRIIHAGKKLSEEHKKKLSVSHIGKGKGKVRTAEMRLKYSQAAKGKILSDEQKQKLRKLRLGVYHSEETRMKMSKSQAGKSKTKWADRSGNQWKAIKVIDTETGQIFDTITKAAKSIGLKPTTLGAMLRGQNKNKTNFTYDS